MAEATEMPSCVFLFSVSVCGSALAEVEISSPVNHSLKHIFICEHSLILFEFCPNVLFLQYWCHWTELMHQTHMLVLILSAVFKALCNAYLEKRSANNKMQLCIRFTLMIYVFWQGWKEKDLPLNNARVVQPSQCFLAVIQSVLLIYLSNMFADLSSENTMRQEQWPWGANYRQLEAEVALLHCASCNPSPLSRAGALL